MNDVAGTYTIPAQEPQTHNRRWNDRPPTPAVATRYRTEAWNTQYHAAFQSLVIEDMLKSLDRQIRRSRIWIAGFSGVGLLIGVFALRGPTFNLGSFEVCGLVSVVCSLSVLVITGLDFARGVYEANEQLERHLVALETVRDMADSLFTLLQDPSNPNLPSAGILDRMMNDLRASRAKCLNASGPRSRARTVIARLDTVQRQQQAQAKLNEYLRTAGLLVDTG